MRKSGTEEGTMAKTKAELDALKEKIKAVKAELGTLSEDELKAIIGGDGETDCDSIYCPECGCQDLSYSNGYFCCRRCGCVFQLNL